MMIGPVFGYCYICHSLLYFAIHGKQCHRYIFNYSTTPHWNWIKQILSSGLLECKLPSDCIPGQWMGNGGYIYQSINRGLSFIILLSEKATQISVTWGSMIKYSTTYILNTNVKWSIIIRCLDKQTYMLISQAHFSYE